MEVSNFKPTVFDHSIGAFFDSDDQRQSWLVAPVFQTRDSGALDRSNFAAALDLLGGESETVEVHRFGHWGPGWYEVIICSPIHAETIASIEASLADYPCLDEESYSDYEWEQFREAWDSWAGKDFAEILCEQFGRDKHGTMADRLKENTDRLLTLYMDLDGEIYDDGPSYRAMVSVAEKVTVKDFVRIVRSLPRF